METTKIEIEAKTFRKNSNCQNLKINQSFIQDIIFTCLIFAVMLIIILNPKRYTAGTISGLKLFFFNVLPGLFPFMLLTKLLTELGTIFKLTKHCEKPARIIFGTPGVSFYAYFSSILSGYPIGAKIIDDLYQKKLITDKDAKKMIVFCTTSGPIFVIGAVGTIMLNSFRLGVILYASHILSCSLLAIIINIFSKKKEGNIVQFPKHAIKKENIFGDCVNQTINAIFVVGAYITIFYLLSEIFDNLKLFEFLSVIFSPISKIFKISPDIIKSVLYGVLEVTRGCKELSAFGGRLPICLCSAIISFSGISIIMQSMAFLKNAKIKMHNFLFVKIVHSILSFILCYLLLIILNVSV